MMSDLQSQPPISSSEMGLPLGFKSIREILDMPNEQLKAKAFVNVIGFVKDYQPPIATRGSGEWSFICLLDFITEVQGRFQMHL